MPYASMEAAKKSGAKTELQGASLSLDQINEIAKVADTIKAEGKVDNPWAVAISQFEKGHHVEGGKWVKNKLKESSINEPWNHKRGINVYETLSLSEGNILPDIESGGQKTRSFKAWWPLLKEGPGNSRDKNYYTTKALESLGERLLTRPKMFFNHIEGEVKPTERNVKEWGASIKESKIENGILYGLVQAYDPWLKERMYDAPSELGASIEARGKANGKIKHNGEDWNAIETVPYLNGVNIVDYPGAAPMGISLAERDAVGGPAEEESIMNGAELKEKFPEVYSEVIAEGKTAAQAEFDKQLKEKADKILALEGEMKTLKESSVDPKVMTEKIALLTAEVAGLKAVETVRGKKSLAEKIVKESGIPAQAISPELISLVEVADDEAHMKAIVAVYAKPFADKVLGHGKTEEKAPAEALKEREAIMMGALGVKIEEKKADDKK